MEAITREEKLMSAAAGGNPSGVKPITREEMFLSYIAGESKTKPSPITRREMFLDKIESGGGGNTPKQENIVFPEDTTGLPTASMNIGGAQITYYRVADFVPLAEMKKAKILYNVDGEIVASTIEVGVISPSGSYSDNVLRVVSVIEDNEEILFDFVGISATFPKAGTYMAYSADMGGALVTEIKFESEGQEDNSLLKPLLEGTIEEITIPNEVTKLRVGGFVGCDDLKEINADESHKVYASANGILYTKDGKKLVSYPPAKEETEYIMPDSVEEVESMAFNGTTRLENMKLSDNIKSLPENIGIENKNAEIELVLNPDILAQGDVYPVGSDLITTVTIPEGSTYLSATAFDNMQGIKNLYYNSECELEMVGVTDSKGWTEYKNGLVGLPNLKKVEIGGTVKNIPSDFLSLPKAKLETLIISDSVETIGDDAFNNVGVDKEFKFGNNVKTIGYQAFVSAINVDTLIIPDSVVELGARDAYGYSENATFQACDFSTLVIGKGLTEIGGYMFASCRNLQKVVIPSNIKNIGQYAFAWCDKLNEVQIESGVETIGDRAFESCYSLAYVYIPSNVKSIGANAFGGCSVLAELQIENGVETIGDYAFTNCASLSDIHIPSSIKSIGMGAFAYCENLTEVRIEQGIEEIGEIAFDGCRRLADIYIPMSVISIQNSAFVEAGAYVEGGLTIHGYAGSYAETFATEYGFNFEVIEE